jgi:hypothetical protein
MSGPSQRHESQLAVRVSNPGPQVETGPSSSFGGFKGFAWDLSSSRYLLGMVQWAPPKPKLELSLRSCSGPHFRTSVNSQLLDPSGPSLVSILMIWENGEAADLLRTNHHCSAGSSFRSWVREIPWHPESVLPYCRPNLNCHGPNPTSEETPKPAR